MSLIFLVYRGNVKAELQNYQQEQSEKVPWG